jgi:alpha-mannosidase
MRNIPAPISVVAPDVILEALKWAESGKAFMARIYEAGGTGCTARISLSTKIRSAAMTNLLEESPEPLPVDHGVVEVGLHPFEIRTLRFEL